MKRLLKVLLGLVLLIVLGIGLLLLLVNPNDFKPELQALARDQGQVELALKGDIGWSLFPSVALSLPALDVTALDGKPLASLQKAEIGVRLLPLLSGRLQMSGVVLDGLKLDWTVPADSTKAEPQPDATGSTSGSDAAESTSGSDAAGSTSGSDTAGALLFDIGYIQISNAQIRYTDPALGQRVEVRGLNLSADNLVSGRDFPLTLGFELALFEGAQASPQLRANTQLQTRLRLDLEAQKFSAKELQLQLNLAGAAFSKPLDLTLSADVEADQSQDSVEIKGLKLALANFLLQAGVKVVGVSEQPLVTGTLQVPGFDLKQLLAALGQPELVTHDETVLRTVGLEAALVGPAGVIGLDSLKLTLDQTTFSGSLSYVLQNGAQRIKLAGDAIDVDRYLPPASDALEAAADASAATTGERYSREPLLPIEILQGLNIDADLALASLKASGLAIEQLKLLLTADAGLINVKQVSGQLYQGSFTHSAIIDARRTPVQLDIKKQITDIQLGAMLLDMADIDRFSGQFSMRGGYQAQGNSVYDIVHSLDGSLDIGLKQGRLKGVNLGDTLCRGILQIKGQQPPAESAQVYTEFSNLSATAKITDGVVVNDDLKAALVGITLTGDGQVDLPAEALNYGMALTVLQDFASDNCRIDEKLHNLALPLRCQGGFNTEPARLCGVDKARIKKVLSKLVTSDAKQQLKQKLEQQLEQKLKGNEQLKGALKGLFK
ncbi:MAG: AsmA family protein [Motiliproteus sp.]